MNVKKHYLFCPGPVNIAQNVKEAVFNEIGHREKEFSELLLSLNSKLLQVYQVKNKKLYQPVFITGSGTSANESVLSSVVHSKRILILSNGEFGDRLYEISKIHNKNTFLLNFGWGSRMDPEKVVEVIKKNKIQMIAMVHHETSIGVINPIEKVGKIAQKNKLIFMVDTVSSVGAEKIDIEKANITFTTGTSGKAIGSFPGIGFVIGKKKEFEKLKENAPKTAYLNLYKFYYYSSTLSQTPNTPGVQLLFALEQALKNILAIGITTRRRNIKEKALMLRKGMKELGLSFYLPDGEMSSVLTTVNLPAYIDIETLKLKLKQKNIVVYNGKGPLTNKVFQVGNIGEFSERDIAYFLKTLGSILKAYKPKVTVAHSKKINNNEIAILNPNILYNDSASPIGRVR